MATGTQAQTTEAPTTLSPAGAKAVAQAALQNHPEDGGLNITYTDKTIDAVTNAIHAEYSEQSTAGGMMSAAGEMFGGLGESTQGLMGKLGKKWPWVAVFAMGGLALASMTGFSGFMGIVVGALLAVAMTAFGAFDGGRSSDFLTASAGGKQRSQDRALNVHERILSASPDELGYERAAAVDEAVQRAGGNRETLANDPEILRFAAWRNEVAARASGYRMINGAMVAFNPGRGRSTGAIAFEKGLDGDGTEIGSSTTIVPNIDAIKEALAKDIVIADKDYGIQPAPGGGTPAPRQRG